MKNDLGQNNETDGVVYMGNPIIKEGLLRNPFMQDFQENPARPVYDGNRRNRPARAQAG